MVRILQNPLPSDKTIRYRGPNGGFITRQAALKLRGKASTETYNLRTKKTIRRVKGYYVTPQVVRTKPKVVLRKIEPIEPVRISPAKLMRLAAIELDNLEDEFEELDYLEDLEDLEDDTEWYKT